MAGYTAGSSQSISELNQRNHYSSIGLELNIPLYSGGSTRALARQASANSAKALDELDATREEVISGTTREYRGVQSGALRIQALEASELAIDARGGAGAPGYVGLDGGNGNDTLVGRGLAAAHDGEELVKRCRFGHRGAAPTGLPRAAFHARAKGRGD